jgi:predicted ArsR family transcriptional regulator
MRPRGEHRTAIVAAVAEHGELGLRDVVARCKVPESKARQVLSDCVRAGELKYRTEARPHARRPVAVYSPAQVLEDMADDGWRELAGVWR